MANDMKLGFAKVNRRHWMGLALALGGQFVAAPAALMARAKSPVCPSTDVLAGPALSPYQPEPALPHMVHSVAHVNGASLSYSDSGGEGAVVILLHAFTGSKDAWAYQIADLVGAGFRVITYSRRGHKGSSGADGDYAGRSVDDLAALADALGAPRFHLVGTAAGGFLALDFALSRPTRLQSLTIASSLAGVDDEAFNAVNAAMTPKSFYQLPPELRELGPSYRAAYPDGVARWVAIEADARSPGTKIPLKAAPVTFAKIGALNLPCHLMTGSADLYSPPSHMARLAKEFRHAMLTIIPEAGHAAYWEQPSLFNRHMVQFLKRH